MATIKDIKDLYNNPKFTDCVNKYYDGNTSYQANRYMDLYTKHISLFGDEPRFFSSSGRIEICGNHTDHNNGMVLAGAISVDTLAAVSATEGDIICISSCGYPKFEINITDLEAHEDERSTSIGLVRGVLRYLSDHGYKLGSFNATMVSDVFKGAGVSSSASFEVLIATIISTMYNNGSISALTKAKASQYAEYHFFGKPCGLLDQCAIALGGVSNIDFADTSLIKARSLVWPFSDLSVVVTNTGGDHSNLTSEYASIRVEMESVAKFFGKQVLREVPEAEFYANMPKLAQAVSGRAILRARHFFEENKRVEKAVRALESNDEQGFINAINESGISSETALQNCMVGGEVAQLIPFALGYSRSIDGVKAVRVHGGGFAGTIIAFVDKAKAQNYINKMKEIFGDGSVFNMDIRDKGTEEVIF